MEDIWDKIISEYKVPIDPISLVIVYRSKDTLKSFQEQYFKDDPTIKIDSESLYMTYTPAEICQKKVYIYSCVCDDKGLDWISSIEVLTKKEEKENIRWLILLDWSIYDQQLWLEHVEACSKQLEEYPIKTVLCMNSEYIYEIQKNVPSWYSYHIDYIQQALRWLCLSQGFNLLYTESKQDNFSTLLPKYVSNMFEEQDVEMVKTTKLLIPKGYDSLNLIKTLDDTFNENNCCVENFKQVIPSPVIKNKSIGSMVQKSQHFTVSDSSLTLPDPHELDCLDIQKQLTKLHDYIKTSNK
ncbi:cytoplasmic dynein intermediate light chain Dyn3p [Monosporozyma servazzii]